MFTTYCMSSHIKIWGHLHRNTHCKCPVEKIEWKVLNGRKTDAPAKVGPAFPSLCLRLLSFFLAKRADL